MTDVPRMLREPRTPWPDWIDEPTKTPAPLNGAAAVVTFIGHSTILIQTPSGNVLTDPMFSRRAGPWNLAGPRRVRAPGVRFDDLPPISAVLVSHNHYDHCDLRTLRALAKRFDPHVVTPLGNRRLLESAHLRRIEELDWWQSSDSAPISMTLTPAHHFSARGILDRNRALWGGFVIAAATRRIYFAGDTDVFDGMRDLGRIDVALLPVAGWGPRLPPGHLDPLRAAEALDLIKPRVAIPIHWGTYSPWKAPTPSDAAMKFAEIAATVAPAVDVLVLSPGQSYALD